MKLQSTSPNVRDTNINVNGNKYFVDVEGLVTVTNEEDVTKLLKLGGAWKPCVERAPVPPEVVKPIVTPPMEEVVTSKDEYPDPKMTMTVAELQEIADAYQVEYTAKTNKKKLVDMIMVAMYGEE